MQGNMLRRKVTLEAIFVYLALFCISTFALLENINLSFPFFSKVKMPLLVIGGVCLFTKFSLFTKNLMRRKYFFVFMTMCILCAMLVWTMYANRTPVIGTSPIQKTVRLILFLLEMFFLAMVIAETGRGKAVLNFLFWYLLVLVIVNDIALFTRIVTFRIGKFEGYILGNKFSVSYLHLDLLALWAARSRKAIEKRKVSFWQVLLITVYLIAVAVRVDCMTGVLGSVIMLGLFVLEETPRRRRALKLTSPILLALALLISVAFAFVVDIIVSVPFVENLIENVLKRNTTLTGRTNIYTEYIAKMTGRWLVGFGYGNGNQAAESLFGYANVQNALLQWVLQVGIFATGALLFLMIQIFRQANKKKEKYPMEVLALVVLIYVYIILGTVEITFNMAFIMWFLLIFALVNERSKQPAPQLPKTAQVNPLYYQAGTRVRR